MFLRGRDMEAENSKLLNILDRFVDHEALFSQEVNKDLLEQLQQRERQYLIAHSRREEDRKAESISPHITAAMNELALYCMAESDEERLNYVMNPAAVAPKMAYWASSRPIQGLPAPGSGQKLQKRGPASDLRADGRQHYPPCGFPV